MTNEDHPPPPTYRIISLDRLRPHPDSVSSFSASDATDYRLLDPFREFGILCPVVVTPDDGGLHTVLDAWAKEPWRP